MRHAEKFRQGQHQEGPQRASPNDATADFHLDQRELKPEHQKMMNIDKSQRHQYYTPTFPKVTDLQLHCKLGPPVFLASEKDG